MMTSSNGIISALLAFCAVPGEFSAQRPVTRSFDVFFDLHLKKQVSKQSRGWWYETSSGSLWRQCNVVDRLFYWRGVHLILNKFDDISLAVATHPPPTPPTTPTPSTHTT